MVVQLVLVMAFIRKLLNIHSVVVQLVLVMAFIRKLLNSSVLITDHSKCLTTQQMPAVSHDTDLNIYT